MSCCKMLFRLTAAPSLLIAAAHTPVYATAAISHLQWLGARRAHSTTASSTVSTSTSTTGTAAIDDASAEVILRRSNEPGQDGITFITLNRPKAKNALSVELLLRMRSALEQIRFDGTTRVIILNSSTLGTFCAGADLKQRKGMTPIQIQSFLYNLRTMLGELSHCNNIPTIAAIDGVALGGGLELALSCDLRVAGHQATKIGLPETRLAIIPGAGGTQRLSRLIGLSKAKDLIFTGRALNAVEAERIGLVNYLADQNQTATERAVQLAQEMLQAGPLALKSAKLAIDRGSQMDLESALDFEHTCYQTIMPSQDRLEGLKAFAEKRKPIYKGE